jgi:hypothetical protein
MSKIICPTIDSMNLTNLIKNTKDIKKVNLIIIKLRKIKKNMKINKLNANKSNDLFLPLYLISYKVITNYLTISNLHLKYLLTYKLEYLEKMHIKQFIINKLLNNSIKCINEI